MVVASILDTILNPIEKILGDIIAFLYNIFPNLGVCIIIVTMLLMLLLYPLTHKQQKSMLAMQALAPKIKELQAKYKDDRQKQSEETMKLYKENGANPFGSCFPMLIQSPFFFSIYRVVRSIQDFIPTNSKLFKSICDPVNTLKACNGNVGSFQSKGFSASQSESLANSLPRGKEFLGMNLSRNLSAALSAQGKDYLAIFAYTVMLILIVVTTYLNIARQQSRNPVQNNKMGFIKYLIPAGAGLFSIILPGGTNLYILVSALWRAGQQEIIFHKVITPHRDKMDLKEKETKLQLESKIDAPKTEDKESEEEIQEKANQARIERKKRKKK
ncbi:MAG: YidC/Oxa1 family membrane protein insertase [Acidimicrobiia bacterium]|nr:YidC/Oxa1 family membrane protein insertase [Acidimicrobiia bacterium]